MLAFGFVLSDLLLSSLLLPRRFVYIRAFVGRSDVQLVTRMWRGNDVFNLAIFKQRIELHVYTT